MTVAELVWALNRAPSNAEVRICKHSPGTDPTNAYIDNRVVQVLEVTNDPEHISIMLESD